MSNLRITVRETSLRYSKSIAKTAAPTERSSFIITIKRDNEQGLGEAAPLDGWSRSPSHVRNRLSDLNGTEFEDTSRITDLLATVSSYPTIRYALNLAHLDLRARYRNQPIHQLLRQRDHDRISVPVNTLHPGPKLDRNRLQRDLKAGYRTVKIKMPNPSPDALDVLQTTLNDPDETPDLRLDGNESWDQDDLATVGRHLTGLPLEYLEQPLDRNNLAGLREARSIAPVALDESLLSVSPQRLFSGDALDFIVVKPQFLGGLDRAQSLVESALEHEVLPVVTTALEGPIGRAGAIQLAGAYHTRVAACGLMTGQFLESEQFWESDHFQDGHLTVPDRSGLGIPDFTGIGQ